MTTTPSPPGEPGEPGTAGTSRPAFGLVGPAAVVAGAVLVIVSLTTLDWLSDRASHVSNLELTLRHSAPDAAGLAQAYFTWLAWLLFSLAVAGAIVAVLPLRVGRPFRVVGLLIGIASAIITLLALKLGRVGTPTLRQYIQHASVGFYLAFFGFLLVALGAVIGPHRFVNRDRTATA